MRLSILISIIIFTLSCTNNKSKERIIETRIADTLANINGDSIVARIDNFQENTQAILCDIYMKDNQFYSYKFLNLYGHVAGCRIINIIPETKLHKIKIKFKYGNVNYTENFVFMPSSHKDYFLDKDRKICYEISFEKESFQKLNENSKNSKFIRVSKYLLDSIPNSWYYTMEGKLKRLEKIKRDENPDINLPEGWDDIMMISTIAAGRNDYNFSDSLVNEHLEYMYALERLFYDERYFRDYGYHVHNMLMIIEDGKLKEQRPE